MEDFPENPYSFFSDWLDEASGSEPDDPNAMMLATADRQGRPSVRAMLMKHYDENGFVFYTNSESVKGRDLAENPQAGLCFHWKSLGRQVRAEGPVELIGAAEADAYFASRPRGSRVGAWASQQSRELSSRNELDERIRLYEEKFGSEDAIPRPPYWNGYRLKPERIEFWLAEEFRLHRRLVYRREETGWSIHMLYP
ncbi:MAG: pyridoxamine 5'-phosphate oxidase [Alphaproteobacteria bacterium]|nr:pyridoxamine 5'-phosphate oxidase [Alphaproteobacteria bacterium]